MNYKIKQAIDDFVDKSDPKNDNGFPSYTKLKRKINKVLIDHGTPGKIATIRFLLIYIENKSPDRFMFNSIKFHYQCAMDKLEDEQGTTTHSENLNEQIEQHKLDQKKKLKRYDTDYWETAIELYEPYKFSKKQVYKKMEEERSDLGLTSRYSKFSTFRQQMTRELKKYG